MMRLPLSILATVATAATTLLAHPLPAATGTPASTTVTKQTGTHAARAAGLPARHKRHSVPRGEVFLGYTHMRSIPTYQTGNRFVAVNGGSASLAFNLNRSIGLVTDFGGFNDTQLRLTGPGYTPNGIVNSKGDAFTFLFGPRFSYRRSERIVPFFQVLAGGMEAGSVTLNPCTTLCTPLPAQFAFAATAGGGLDLKLTPHVALRVVQAEYMLTRFADPTTNITTNQNDIRLSAGLVFGFGGKPHEVNHPPTVSCMVDRSSVPTGSLEPLTVHATAEDADNDPLTYTWAASGGAVTSQGSQASWTPQDATPGTYTISSLVSDGRGGSAGCSTNVRVEAVANRPPTLTCSADPSTVVAGAPVQVTAVSGDPDNDPVTLTWETSAGQIKGSGSPVQIDTTGLPATRLTIHGHVFDGRGGLAECIVNVDTTATPPRVVDPLIERLKLHSIYFPTAKPDVEHPDSGIVQSQQATLLTLAADFNKYLEKAPAAHLTLEGHADPRASEQYNQQLSARRVMSTKRFLVEHGVPAANIDVTALGDDSNLSREQVRDAVQHTPQLSDSDRGRMLADLDTVWLASNRRVDVVLNSDDQQSARDFPFNVADSLTLLRQHASESGMGHAKRKKR